MGHNDHIDQEEGDLQAFVNDLISEGELEDTSLGVAKLFVNQGFIGLSDKQKYVLQRYVIDAHKPGGCKDCTESIPTSEWSAARDNDGLCSRCEYNASKG